MIARVYCFWRAARELRFRAALFIPEKKQQISRQAGCGGGEKTHRKADIRQTAVYRIDNGAGTFKKYRLKTQSGGTVGNVDLFVLKPALQRIEKRNGKLYADDTDC